MLLHEFGEDLVLALELGFERFARFVLGVLDSLGFAAVVAGDMSVLDELLLPAVEEVGGDGEFIAAIGHGDFFQEVPFEDGDLLLGAKVTTRLGQGKPPYRLC
jgi:hypothetical protein